VTQLSYPHIYQQQLLSIQLTTYIVNDQLLFIILPSKLPDTHLDEILEGGVHVDILVLQLIAAGPKLYFLHKPERSNNW